MVAHWSAEVVADRASAVVPDAVTLPPPPASGVANVARSEGRSGASSSFAELYWTHLTYVWKTARRLGVTDAEVEDVVQETFFTAHRRSATFETLGAERAWLFATVYRVVLHHRRSFRRRSALTEDGMDLDAFPASPAAAPDRSAETSETVRLLEAILDSLDPEKRAVLVLVELEGKPLIEIAEILEINVNTVSSRLRLAREAVEAAMARHRARDGWRYK
ncbi:MAG: RNA polymerase sigma factor [Myxococcales bacterium]|nr:RNA polymerase sigma factor [Myxococcales bacterium]